MGNPLIEKLLEDLRLYKPKIECHKTARYIGFYAGNGRGQFCWIDEQEGGKKLKVGVVEKDKDKIQPNGIQFIPFPPWNRSEMVSFWFTENKPEISAFLCCCCSLTRYELVHNLDPRLSFEEYLNKYKFKMSLEKTLPDDLKLYDQDTNSVEGGKKVRFSSYYERNPELRKQAILHHGLTCKACGFNFEKIYGERGGNFIEVHHLTPLSEIKEAVSINPKVDMTVVCSNCHIMIHRKRDDILSLEKMKAIIKKHLNR